MSSKMPQIYLHCLGNESVNSILEARGLLDKDSNKRDKSNLLKSTYCHDCNEPNKRDSKFCTKCKMALSYDSYQEVLENQKEKEEELKLLVLDSRFFTVKSRFSISRRSCYTSRVIATGPVRTNMFLMCKYFPVLIVEVFQ
jgi:hypothetical protein